MGDRGSISISGKEAGPVLFRHWGGSPEAMMELAEAVRRAIGRHKRTASASSDPYTRGEPDAIFALVVRLAVETDGDSAYVGVDMEDGDSSDNGHYVLDPQTFELEHEGVVIRISTREKKERR